jgi:hypothetical protein
LKFKISLKKAPALTNYNIKYAQKHFENLETLSQQQQQQQQQTSSSSSSSSASQQSYRK